jgi:hypothetical protein
VTSTAEPLPAGDVDRIPSGFGTYWEKGRAKQIRLARRAFKALFRFDLLPPDEKVRKFALGYYDGDAMADEFVGEVCRERTESECWAMLEQGIEDGVEAVQDRPGSMVRLFRELERDPDWLDMELVQLGAKSFRHYGPAVFSLAGASTLLSYTESSIVKPLAFTGAYAGESALRRFMETSRFWIDVSEPGALMPGGDGRGTAMRVRVLHALVRRRLMNHGDWDLDSWGVPISQSDALVTLIASSLTPGFGLRLMGYRTSLAEIGAMMHFWRYIGHLMGVQPRWYPADVKEAIQLSAVFFIKREFSAGEDGVELIESYPAAFKPEHGTPLTKRLRDEVNYRAQLGYTRFFLPGSFYRRYDMPNPWPWALHPLLQAPAIFAIETLRRRSETVDRLQDRYARWRRETWWRNEMGHKPSHFH